MFASNVVVISICGLWLYWQRQSSQVRVSQPYFLLLVLFGCLISSSTIIAMALQDDTDGEPPLACMAMPWLYSVGFSITFGTLFAKIRRVYKLFTAPPVSSSSSAMSGSSRRGGSVTLLDTILCIGVVLLVDVVILICWSVIDPLYWEREVIREDQFGDPLESQGYCTCDSWEIFASIIAFFHFGLLAVACYMCYVARNIPSKYSEHKFVTIAMISNFQIFVVGVPICFILAGDPGGNLFVRSAIVWMNDLVVVTLIFGNLMQSVHFPDKQVEHTPSEGDFFEGDTVSKLDVAALQYKSNSPQLGDRGDTSPDTESRKISPKTPIRPPVFGVSSLSYPSSVLSQQSSSKPVSCTLKSVSFNENVSVSEIPLSEYEFINDGAAGDRFAAIAKVEKAPLKPSRFAVDTPGSVAEPPTNVKRRPSWDSIPSMPKRPTPGVSETEEIVQDHSAESPRPETRVRQSSFDASPSVPERVISEREDFDEDKTMDDSHSSGRPPPVRRGLSFDSNHPRTVPKKQRTPPDTFQSARRLAAELSSSTSRSRPGVLRGLS
jgi:hypothetical protein